MRCKHFFFGVLMLLAAAVQALAGNVYWIGNAAAVPQKTTFTVSGVWVSGDTATTTVNNKTCTITLGSVSTSTTDVASALAAAINSNDSSTTVVDLISDETKNIGGQKITEFRDFTAKAVGSVVTLTGTTDGRPFTAVSSEVTADTGAIADATPTAATGPNFYNNASNWDTGTAPVSGDDVFFSQGSTDCFYGMTDPNGVTAPNSFTREPGYSGRIGLPRMNNDFGTAYYEYRPTHLQLQPSAAGKIYRIAGGGRTNIDIVDQNASITVEGGAATSLITGTGVITLTATSGNVQLGNKGESTCVLGAITCGSPAGTSAAVNVSSSCTGTISLIIYNGSALVDVAMGGSLIVHKGVLTVLSGAQSTVELRGGNLVYNGTGTLTTLDIRKGHGDFSNDLRAKTVTNLNLWKGAAFSDPFGVVTLTNGMDLEDCGLHEVSVISVISRTWTATGL